MMIHDGLCAPPAAYLIGTQVVAVHYTKRYIVAPGHISGQVSGMLQKEYSLHHSGGGGRIAVVEKDLLSEKEAV